MFPTFDAVFDSNGRDVRKPSVVLGACKDDRLFIFDPYFCVLRHAYGKANPVFIPFSHRGGGSQNSFQYQKACVPGFVIYSVNQLHPQAGALLFSVLVGQSCSGRSGANSWSKRLGICYQSPCAPLLMQLHTITAIDGLDEGSTN